jgi:chromosome partitioning protein
VSTIIAVSHHAGGVGKTTTALNLGFALEQQGARVLLVDLDPQADLSLRLGIDAGVCISNLATALVARVPLATFRCIWGDPYGAVTVAPSDLETMAGVDLKLAAVQMREQRLRQVLEPRRVEFDYILLDCPPALSLLTINALYAADSLLVPVQAQDKALRQIGPLLQTVDEVRGYRGGLPRLAGLLLTMTDATRQSREAETALRAAYPGQVFATMIPRRTALADDGRYHAPIAVYQPESAAAGAYTALAQEILHAEH